MTQLSKHPILWQIYEACQAIEDCGASEALTKAVTLTGGISDPVEALVDDRDAAIKARDCSQKEQTRLARQIAELNDKLAELKRRHLSIEHHAAELWRSRAEYLATMNDGQNTSAYWAKLDNLIALERDDEDDEDSSKGKKTK